ncbi:hypothetical protein [Streptomyces hydrogenans]
MRVRLHSTRVTGPSGGVVMPATPARTTRTAPGTPGRADTAARTASSVA